jgi:uncharacterized membrane protein YqaE (UPF0057 family)
MRPSQTLKRQMIGEKIMSILILIASILLPPLGVALKHGIGRDFWINLILTIILFVPGVIHAVYVNFLR